MLNHYFLAFRLTILFFGCCSSNHQREGTVHIEKENNRYRLIRNGTPFLVQGVSGKTRLKELQEIGGNCIRTYDTTNLGATLDEAEKLGLAVIAGVWLPKSKSDWFYKNDTYIEEAAIKLKALGEKYGSHPALLSWCLGNELIFYDFKDWSFSQAYNQILDSLRVGDPNHPIGTALANYGDKAIINFGLKIPDIDLVYINTFGRLNQLASDRERWEWFFDKPFLVGEFGENGPWESNGTVWGAPGELNSSQKAERLKTIYETVMPSEHPAFLGSLAFFWGWRQEQTHTWFNVFSKEGEKNEMYFTLAEVFGKNLKMNRPPMIEPLSIDSIFASNQLFLKSNSRHFAQLNAKDPEQDSLRFFWSIRTEDWFHIKGDTPPDAIANTMDTTLTIDGLNYFNSPSKPGAYRLFVRVIDGKGNFASVNLPFYVVPE
ncbi:MAG: hypothetical protein ACJAZH_001578 [Roseivirga sp.]